jgi:hypothetical protein
MFTMFAIVSIILYVAQAQIDILLAPSSTNRTLKLCALVAATLLVLFLHYGRGY